MWILGLPHAQTGVALNDPCESFSTQDILWSYHLYSSHISKGLEQTFTEAGPLTLRVIFCLKVMGE